MALRRLPAARRVLGFRGREEGPLASAMAAAAEAGTASGDCLEDRVFRQLMARQYADRGQIMVALSQKAADDFVRFHQVRPGADPHRLQRRGRGAVFAGGVPHRAGDAPPPGHRAADRALADRGPQLPTQRRRHAAAAPGGGCGAAAAGAAGGRGRQASGTLAADWRRGWAWPTRSTSSGRWRTSLPYYAAADIYVHPTIYDTCSLVVLEAAACGLPVVTTRCNGAAELFHDGRDILLVADPARRRGLGGEGRGASGPGGPPRLGAAARQIAMRHTFEQNVDHILDLYQESSERRVRRAGGPWCGRAA